MNIADLFRRRRYTKQTPRCYWPRSPWDNTMGGYSMVGDPVPNRCYLVRGISLHTPQGREWLRSHKAMLPQPPDAVPPWPDGPPFVREVHPAASHPLIPPVALTLILLADGPAWFDTIDQFVWWVDARSRAKLLLKMFSLPDPLAWLFLIRWMLHRTKRPLILKALGLLKWVDETYKAKQDGSKSVPANGPGKNASTV